MSENKAGPKADSRVTVKSVIKVLMILSLAFGLLIAGLGITVGMGWVPSSQFGPGAQRFLDQIFSPLPTLPDVSPEQYSTLLQAAQAPLAQNGPKIAVALSNTSLERPVFYFATNLPDGINLAAQVIGVPGTLVSEKSVNIRFPVIPLRRFAKSKPVRAIDGGALPLGEYLVVVTDDQEQPESVKAFLSSLPVQQQVPQGVTPDRKILFVTRAFLGGARDQTYQTKLAEFQAGIRARAQADLKQMTAALDKIQAGAAATTEAWLKLTKAPSKPASLKAWNAFHEQWAAQWTAPDLTGLFYPRTLEQLRGLWQELQKLHGAQQAYATAAPRARSGLQRQVQAAVDAFDQKLVEARTRVGAIAADAADMSKVPQPEL